MQNQFVITIFITLSLSFCAPNANALTMKQFSDICHSSPNECSEHPIIQAYIGGALDLLATLDEQTDYLKKMYCKMPKELFDAPSIIQFMEQRSEQYQEKNTMLILVRYFEEHGGCKHE